MLQEEKHIHGPVHQVVKHENIYHMDKQTKNMQKYFSGRTIRYTIISFVKSVHKTLVNMPISILFQSS